MQEADQILQQRLTGKGGGEDLNIESVEEGKPCIEMVRLDIFIGSHVSAARSVISCLSVGVVRSTPRFHVLSHR